MYKNYFRQNIKSISFSNPQKFIGIQIPVKKVILIIIKAKDFLRIVFKKDFLIKVQQVEQKIAPRNKYCKILEISIH